MGFNCLVEIHIECNSEELVEEFMQQLNIHDIELEPFCENEWFFKGEIYNGCYIEDDVKSIIKCEKYKDLKFYFGYINIDDIGCKLLN